MGLDVYLNSDPVRVKCVCAECDHEHMRDQVEELYWANITHNLGAMAKEAGIKDYLWVPDDIGISKASQLIIPLEHGLRRLEGDPEGFRKHNPPNGWGNYEGFVKFVRNYLEACKEYPEANVYASR